MREFNAVDNKVFYHKWLITAYAKWLIFSFEQIRMCKSSVTSQIRLGMINCTFQDV